MGLQPAGFGAVGGAGQPGDVTLRHFPFAYNTPSLDTGAALYIPTVGDLLLQAWISVGTAWNGTTPKGVVGLFTSGFGQLDPEDSVDMTVADATTLGFQITADSNYTLPDWCTVRVIKALTADPICVAVSVDANPVITEAAVTADTTATVPLVVVTGVNDQFVFTGDGGAGSPETFTVAPGTYATFAAVVAAMAAAIGSAHGETFDTISAVGGTGGTITLTMVGSGGANDNNNTLGPGSDDVSVSLGFTADPDTYGGGTGGAPGSTQGAGILYLLTGTPA